MKYEINVKKLENPKGNVMGYANLVFEECLKVTRIAIVKNKEGELFVSMPRYVANNGEEYKDICNPITKEFRAELYQAILDTYQKTALDEYKTVAFGEKEQELNFDVRTSPLEQKDSKVKGISRVYVNDCFVINNISLIEGKNGMFVSMPSYKTNQVDEQGKAIYQDLIYPVTKDFREKLFGEVKASYEEQKSKKQDAIKSNLGKNASKTETERDTPFR